MRLLYRIEEILTMGAERVNAEALGSWDKRIENRT
jgi:hypothetical protein